MAIAAPRIDSVTRPTANRTWLQVDYTAMQSGYNRIYAYVNGVQATTTDTMNGQVLITSVGGSPMPPANSTPAVELVARHATNELSPRSNKVNAPAWKPNTPTLTAAVRSSSSQATLTMSGLLVGGRCYIKRRTLPSGNFAQVDAFDITASSVVRTAPAPNGNTEYEFQITQGMWSVESDASSSRSVDAWWQTPPAPTNLVGSRVNNGTTTLAWTLPSRTSRNDWTGFDVFRAAKGAPMPASYFRRTTGTASDFTDATADPTKAYTYWVRPYNSSTGTASAPSVSVDPVLLPPEPASGASVTHLSGNTWRVSWSVPAADPERPVWTQQILGRVPGQTSTVTLASVMSGETQYDLTLPDNRIYEVSVLTVGIEPASSTSNWTGPVVSAPKAPASTSAAWLDGTNIRVSWPSVTDSIGDLLRVEFSTQANPDRNNPAHWSVATTLSSWQGTTGWTHPSLTAAVPHTYRTRAEHVASGLASSWRYSATVAPQSVPLKPTMVMPWKVDATATIPLLAIHNPSDGTAATAAEFQHRPQGASTWPAAVAGTIDTVGRAAYTVPANTYTNGSTMYMEARSRTAGATGVLGPWSDVLLVPLRARPVAAITRPVPGVLESQTMVTEWTATRQVSARLELWDDTDGNLQLVGTYTAGPGERSHTWDAILLDGHDYVVDLAVRDEWQTAEPQQVVVSVSYNLPAPPELVAEQAPAASVLLQAAPRAGLDVQRYNFSNQFATWTPLSGGSVGTATLTVDGEAIETTTLQGGATTAESDYNGAAYVVGGFMAYSETGTILEVNRYEGEFSVGSVLVTLPAGVPTPVRFSASTGSAAHTWRVASYGPTHIWDQVLLTFPPGTSTIDESYFDASTVREGYVYGRLASGEFYEAIPSSAPANPLPAAATVSIEIWCSESGLPGTYRLCGVTGSGWDYHDEHPRIGVPTWYVARAVAESGAWAESTPVRMVVDSRDTYVHYGEGYSSYVVAGRLVDALTIDGGGLDVESIQYEGHDGWTHHSTDTPLAESISVDLQLLPARGASSLAEWATALRHDDIIYREPGGIIMRGAPSMGPRKPSSRFVQRLSLTVAGEML